MVRKENHCVSCPPEMGCLGSACPNRNVIMLYCDKCKDPVDLLYKYDGEELCADCLLSYCETVEGDE